MSDFQFFLILLGILIIALLALLLFRPRSKSPEQETVSRELYKTIVAQNEIMRLELAAKEQEIRETQAALAARDQSILHLQDQLGHQQQDWAAARKQLQTEFENLANRLLEEKSQRFTEQNARNLQQVLHPLREKIKEFEENVERKFLDETREKSSLKTEIAQLFQLNQQLSLDAHQLTAALKGQSKVQGDWGELQLETLLEKSGLQKGTHFLMQNSFRDNQGNAKRPDFIIQLPQNRHIIIDAKVSLTAYEQYFNERDPVQQEVHLKAHLDSIRRHVADLSSKDYQNLYQINTPDYLLLFVPIEGALQLAAQIDPKLLADAMERNILLVSNASLMATMRTVAHVWKQEKQTRSVLEIARQSGLLYDKFVGFVEDLRNIGARLDSAQNAYADAYNKLVNSPKYGDTLVGRAEKLRKLGAKSSKSLPAELVEEEKPVSDDERLEHESE